LGSADRVPPAAQAGHGERGGVVVGAHADPAGVRAQVVDSVRDGFAQLPIEEVVHVHRDRLTRWAPLPAGVAVLADQFLLLRVHTDHRIPARLVATPYVNRRSVRKLEWGKLTRGQIPDARQIAAAHILATYMDGNGWDAWPGDELMAEALSLALSCSLATVKRVMAALDDSGWITLVIAPSSRRSGMANVYWSSLPAPFAVEQGFWDPNERT
jgi:hypothetical protein